MSSPVSQTHDLHMSSCQNKNESLRDNSEGLAGFRRLRRDEVVLEVEHSRSRPVSELVDGLELEDSESTSVDSDSAIFC